MAETTILPSSSGRSSYSNTEKWRSSLVLQALRKDDRYKMTLQQAMSTAIEALEWIAHETRSYDTRFKPKDTFFGNEVIDIKATLAMEKGCLAGIQSCARQALASIRAARDTPDDADVEYGLEWLMGVKESLQTEMDYERDHPRAGEMDHYRSLKQDFDCVDGIIRALQSKRDAQGGK